MMNAPKPLILTLCAVWLAAMAPAMAAASPGQAYGAAIDMAARGRTAEAIAMMQGAAATLPAADPWRQRLEAARRLLAMRRTHAVAASAPGDNGWMLLADRFMRAHPEPAATPVWPVGLLATILPGAGHARLGRWRDAATAALLVWPMLLLTVWAARRRMGPVTVFFAMITLWLWSGTVFSAVSLAERGGAEAYMAWWQHLWLASGLPGRPW